MTVGWVLLIAGFTALFVALVMWPAIAAGRKDDHTHKRLEGDQ